MRFVFDDLPMASTYYNLFNSSMPLNFSIFSKNNVWFGCSLLFGCMYTLYHGSVIFVTAVTAERYYAIRFPLRHWACKRHTVTITVLSWIFSIILGIATIFRDSNFIQYCIIWPPGREFESFPNVTTYCQPSYPAAIASEFILLVQFTVCMLVTISMYGHIIYILANRANLASNSIEQQTERFRVRNQVARLTIISGTIFFVCQAPYRIQCIQSIVFYFTGYRIFDDDQFGQLYMISSFTMLLNSATNVLVYYVTSSYYRQGLKEALFGKCTTTTAVYSDERNQFRMRPRTSETTNL